MFGNEKFYFISMMVRPFERRWVIVFLGIVPFLVWTLLISIEGIANLYVVGSNVCCVAACLLFGFSCLFGSLLVYVFVLFQSVDFVFIYLVIGFNWKIHEILKKKCIKLISNCFHSSLFAGSSCLFFFLFRFFSFFIVWICIVPCFDYNHKHLIRLSTQHQIVIKVDIRLVVYIDCCYSFTISLYVRPTIYSSLIEKILTLPEIHSRLYLWIGSFIRIIFFEVKQSLLPSNLYLTIMLVLSLLRNLLFWSQVISMLCMHAYICCYAHKQLFFKKHLCSIYE